MAVLIEQVTGVPVPFQKLIYKGNLHVGPCFLQMMVVPFVLMTFRCLCFECQKDFLRPLAFFSYCFFYFFPPSLIFHLGKSLKELEQPLSALGVKNGCKVMLIGKRVSVDFVFFYLNYCNFCQ